jgi:CRP-like cAMP-binding protein
MNDRDDVETLHFDPGQRIFTQGDGAYGAFMLETGKVSMHQHIDGHQLDLDPVKPGEIFGEMALLGAVRRMGTAVADTECTVSVLPASAFARRMQAADRWLRALIDMVARNIQVSHRVFLRRPRSFRDHVRQMAALSANIRRFSARVPEPPLAEAMGAALDRLETALADLDRLSLLCPDRRHDIILDVDEADGLGLDEVVGSESRRRVFVTPTGR